LERDRGKPCSRGGSLISKNPTQSKKRGTIKGKRGKKHSPSAKQLWKDIWVKKGGENSKNPVETRFYPFNKQKSFQNNQGGRFLILPGGGEGKGEKGKKRNYLRDGGGGGVRGFFHFSTRKEIRERACFLVKE